MSLSNDQKLVDILVKGSHTRKSYGCHINKYFEIYVTKHILKSRSHSLERLSPEQLFDGNVGDTEDGGIDGIYLFVGGELVNEKNIESFLGRIRNVIIDLFVIQSKNSKRSPMTAIERLTTTSRDLLNPQKSLSEFKDVYSAKILEIFQHFRCVKSSVLETSTCINLRFYYVTKGANQPRHLAAKTKQLRESVEELVPECDFYFDYLGASKLLTLIRNRSWTQLTLAVSGRPIAAEERDSFVALATLHDYFSFISDNKGALRESLFEANVRDWQGNNKTNAQILLSLEARPVREFWWLNNGVTILATRVEQAGNTLRLENPSIVNGLQTTRTIHQYCSRTNPQMMIDQKILVRVIAASDEHETTGREHIIRATNSQTRVKAESLRSLDKIHYDIETFMNSQAEPVYYERRDKFYRNLGKPRSSIIGITRLTQAVLATALFKPGDASWRPGDFLKASGDERYLSVFNEKYDLNLYYFSTLLLHRVSEMLRNDNLFPGTNRFLRTRLQFHVLTHIVLRHLDVKRAQIPSPPRLVEKQHVGDVHDDLRLESAKRVVTLYYDLTTRHEGLGWRSFSDAFFEDLDKLLQ